MDRKQRVIPYIVCGSGILVLILDSKVALSGAAAGIEICLRTAIPALFPFMVLATVLISGLQGRRVSLFTPINRLCHIPEGAESAFLVGLLGGYPVGAQCIALTYNQGGLGKAQAQRMLGFCSNAGPSFLFGIAATAFSSRAAGWWLWGIHILSAIVVGCLLPCDETDAAKVGRASPVSAVQALKSCVRTMAYICGWIVLMRVVIAFLDRWFLWLLPDALRAFIIGSIELVNGCHNLYYIPSEGTRFVLCSGILALGGICIGLQTVSVTDSLGLGLYFPGKVMQAIISILLSFGVQSILFPAEQRMQDTVTFAIILTVLITAILPFLRFLKKRVAFSENVVYNR